MSRYKIFGLALVAAIVAAVGIYTFTSIGAPAQIQVTGYFSSATGLYVGNEVEILGVPVGEVTAIHPEGTQVAITFSYDASDKVPANAMAAIVSPSLVASRFIQLAPVYSGGPTLQNNAVIPLSQTAVPVEWSQVQQQLTRLTKALGPNGVNKTGSLSQLITVASANLGGGTAQLLHDSITGLAQAVDGISSSRGDLFGTITNLDAFVSNLVKNDAAVTSFSGQLNSVSALLATNKTQLATAVNSLDQALTEMTTFLRTNKGAVSNDVAALTTPSKALNGETSSLADILDTAPTALANFYNIIDPRYQALTGRLSADNLTNSAAALICGAVGGVVDLTTRSGQATFAQECAQGLNPLAQLLHLQNGLPGAPGASSPVAATSVGTPTVATGAPSLPSTITSVTGGATGLLGLLLPGGST